MKNISIILLVFVLVGSLRTALAVTNDVFFANSYEKITRGVVNDFKEDENALMRMQTSDRGLKTEMWLRLLNQIDQMRDFSFDPLNRTNSGYMNLAPPFDPANTNTWGYVSGMDPSGIKDAQVRHEYEEALRENHQKALRRTYETKLKNLGEECTFEASEFFKSAYAKTPEDAKALITSLDAVKDEKHRSELKDKLGDYIKLLKN